MRGRWPIVGLLLLAFCLLGAANAAAAVTLPPGFQSEVVLEANPPGVEGTNETTNFKFAPDGRIFVATKGGKILVYQPGQHQASEATLFADLAKQTYDNGDHGLLGLALDPKFDSGRPYVYALYTYNHELGAPAGAMPEFPSSGSGSTEYEGDACPVENECVVSGRLVRLTAEGDQAKENVLSGEAEEAVLLEDWCQQSSSHSIGDLGFGPEGALYVSGGEGAIYTDRDYGQYENLCDDPPGVKGTPLEPPTAEGGSLRSQSLLRPGAKESANGKVLLSGTLDRIDPDTGEGWPGNPEAASPNANARRIVGFGFRNPFRFVVNQRLGDVFLGNVGANKWEEIDRVPLGAPLYNSGWPCYEADELSEFAVLGLAACERLEHTPGSTAAPFFYYSHFQPVVPGDECSYKNGSAISGQAFYEGSSYPAEYDNALFFSDSVRGCIYVMLADDEDGEPDPATVRPFLSSDEPKYPGVDIEQGPEGSIYYTTLDDGKISRVVYDPEVVTARLTTTGHPWGNAPLSVTFNAGGSTAPSGHTLEYEWDLTEGGFGTPTTSATKSRTYTDGTKNVHVAVRVKDAQTGKTSIAAMTVYPGDSPPQITFITPEPSLTWGVGDRIEFEGYANSMEQGNEHADMPEEDLFWKTRLLHCPHEASSCHEHPLQVFPGVKGGTVLAPDHSYPSYINFILSASDARGLSNEASVKIKARPIPLQIHSEPPGIEIGVGESSVTTPAEYLVIENSRTTVAAPNEAVVGGVKYAFQGWSDGGARVHEVSSTEPGTYTAIYREVPSPPSGGGGDGGGGGGGNGTGGGGVGASGTEPVKPVPPKLKGRPPKQTSSTTAKFVFGGPAGTSFQCKLDRGKLAGCRSPRIYRKLKPGRHTVRIYATDGSGGRSAATVFSWKIVPRA
jgi:glucose/arabinose dehydrogenase